MKRTVIVVLVVAVVLVELVKLCQLIPIQLLQVLQPKLGACPLVEAGTALSAHTARALATKAGIRCYRWRGVPCI